MVNSAPANCGPKLPLPQPDSRRNRQTVCPSFRRSAGNGLFPQQEASAGALHVDPGLEAILCSNEIWLSNPLLVNEKEEVSFGIQTRSTALSREFGSRNRTWGRKVTGDLLSETREKALEAAISIAEPVIFLRILLSRIYRKNSIFFTAYPMRPRPSTTLLRNDRGDFLVAEPADFP
jgi:hypothetical protein